MYFISFIYLFQRRRMRSDLALSVSKDSDSDNFSTITLRATRTDNSLVPNTSRFASLVEPSPSRLTSKSRVSICKGGASFGAIILASCKSMLPGEYLSSNVNFKRATGVSCLRQSSNIFKTANMPSGSIGLFSVARLPFSRLYIIWMVGVFENNPPISTFSTFRKS